MGTLTVTGRADLTDAQWAVLEPLLQARADATGMITWDVNVDSTVARAHQHAAARGKGGSAGRAARRGGHRTAGSRPGPVPRRADLQGAPGLPAGPETPVDPDHRGAARRQPAVPGRLGAHPRPPPGPRAPPDPAAAGTGRQGPRFPRQPRLPAAPRNLVHYPGKG